MKRKSSKLDFNSIADRPRSANAAQQLLQYVRQRGLQAGDQLPPQSQLRGELGFSNDSLSAAMSTLVRSGVLIRKPGLGTIVVDPTKTVSGVWRVGLAVLPSVKGQAYYGQLLLSLQIHLASLGSTTTYIPDHEIAGGNTTLDDYGLLLDDLKGGRLHGALIMSGAGRKELDYWNSRGIPLLHIGPWEGAPVGVVIDQAPMVEQGVALLWQRNIRQIGVVSIGGPTTGHRRFWDAFVQTMNNAGQPVDERTHSYFGGEGALGGARVAKRLLSMPAHLRPQGLVVIDDRLAAGLTAVLAEQTEYRPTMVVQTNVQAPIAFSLPVIHVELDVDDMARAASADMLERLIHPDMPPSLHWIAPRFRDLKESHYVLHGADSVSVGRA